jgi:DNA-3-methyladenine glycosylase
MGLQKPISFIIFYLVALCMELTKDFFKADAIKVAKALLGKELRFGKCSGIIVETEAYAGDGASHAARRTKRSIPLFEKHGTTYVYLNYGMYHLLNFTCDARGPGGVLIRAVEPRSGIKLMEKRRKTKEVYSLCNGPGKLCQAFGITMKHHDRKVGEEVKITETGAKPEIKCSPRIGISFSKDLLWRFYIKDNKFVSKV